MSEKARVLFIDRKGEKGSIELPIAGEDTEAANIQAFMDYSYVGVTETIRYFRIIPQTALAAGSDNVVNNDKDFKAILGFRGADGYFKITIPAPKINIEGGICIRWGKERAEIPAVKAEGELGDDGAAIQSKLRTLSGDNSIAFESGRLYKRP